MDKPKFNLGQSIKQAQDTRDIKAIFDYLVADNNRRIKRGLPSYTPSYELAEKILRNEK